MSHFLHFDQTTDSSSIDTGNRTDQSNRVDRIRVLLTVFLIQLVDCIFKLLHILMDSLSVKNLCSSYTRSNNS